MSAMNVATVAQSQRFSGISFPMFSQFFAQSSSIHPSQLTAMTSASPPRIILSVVSPLLRAIAVNRIGTAHVNRIAEM
jgi:hypothetical protein